MTQSILEVNSLAKSFGAFKVLQDVRFQVGKGDIVGLLGPNGSGKSTLLNIISGFIAPDRGSVVLDGKNISSIPTFRIVREGLARTFQLPSMPQKMSVLEVAMAADTRMHGVISTLIKGPSMRKAECATREQAMHLLEELLLTKVSHMPASAISGGQKKLLGIVCALMARPRLLMLDEPTAGVHPNLRQDIVRALHRLNEQGMTLVIVEHDMHFIREACNRCIVLDQGHIVANCKPQELTANERVVQAYLGATVAEAEVEEIEQ